MTDIPSRSYGSVPQWHCKSDAALRNLFNSLFPLPHQASWTVFHLSSAICTKVTSILQMKISLMDEWRRLPRLGNISGPVGSSMLGLWEWTLTYRAPRLSTAPDASQDSAHASEQDILAEAARSQLEQFQALSRPLARRLQWPRAPTQQN